MKKDNLLRQLVNAYKRLQEALEIPLSEALALDLENNKSIFGRPGNHLPFTKGMLERGI